jgi:membrane dipeptidase
MDESRNAGPTRRAVLSTAALGALALATGSAADEPAPIVNALGGLDDPNPELAKPAGAVDSGDPELDDRAIRDAREAGLTAVNVTLGYVAGPMEPFEYTVRQIGLWDRLIREHPADLLRVERATDILRARREGRIGIIYGFQNAVQLGDKPERVDLFGDLGVRVIQLTYNPANALGDGSAALGNRGLTTFGHQVVERLNQQRIMVDLSHSGERTCLDAIRASKQPVSINHTGCRALNDLPRNKTDEELRLVAERGGFVGIYFMPFLAKSGHATAEEVVAHVEHAVKICGEDHVGIGTDGSVTTIDDLDAFRAHTAADVAERAKSGIGAAGERADTLPFVIDLRGPDQFRKLAGLLRARGHSQARIDKILGLNFIAFAREVWGG